MPIIRKFFDGQHRPDAEAQLRRGDLRDMIRARCENGHEWWAPRIGNCPTCKSPNATELERKMSGAPRV